MLLKCFMYIKKVENNEIEAIDKYMNYNNK